MYCRWPKLCRNYRLFLENDLPALYCDGFIEYTNNGEWRPLYIAYFHLNININILIYTKLCFFPKQGLGRIKVFFWSPNDNVHSELYTLLQLQQLFREFTWWNRSKSIKRRLLWQYCGYSYHELFIYEISRLLLEALYDKNNPKTCITN